MAKIYGQLERAALEVLSSDPAAGITGRVLWNSTDGQAKLDDGTNYRALLRNDLKAIIGNNGTPNNNIRFHRGANEVLQFLRGGDSTAEGSLSTALAQISGRLENYAFSSLPAAGNAGRVAWVTDQGIARVDNGTTWLPLGSGGGGGALQWIEGANSALLQFLNNMRSYAFEAGLQQDLWSTVKVPDNYVSGSQITMRLHYFTPDTSGTVLLQTIATLLRQGTDAADSVVNQRTSTNAAVTLSGAANLVRTVTFDLTSTTGQINGVNVSANDLIKVELTRGTDTATSDVQALVFSADLKFN